MRESVEGEYGNPSERGGDRAACVITIVDAAFRSGIFGAIISGFRFNRSLLQGKKAGRGGIVCNRGRFGAIHKGRPHQEGGGG